MRNVGPRKSPVMSQARHGARIQARCRCDQVSLFRTLTRSACLVPRPYSPISFRAVLGISPTSRTAVYGLVCTVVEEGRSCEAPPIPIVGPEPHVNDGHSIFALP